MNTNLEDADENAKVSSSWLVFVTKDDFVSSKLNPVFRRFSARLKHSGVRFATVLCKSDSIYNDNPSVLDGICTNTSDLPELQYFLPTEDLAGLKHVYSVHGEQIFASLKAREFTYDKEQSSFAAVLETLFTVNKASSINFVPDTVEITGAPSRYVRINQEYRVAFTLNGIYDRGGEVEGRPFYIMRDSEFTSSNIYIRFLRKAKPGKKDAWLISDRLDPVDMGWAVLEDNSVYLPVDCEKQWLAVNFESNKWEMQTDMKVQIFRTTADTAMSYENENTTASVDDCQHIS
eukprot:CAMPEP_0204827402 /NCGR_PEP_ID=MMETSP1346-20131115/4871_1 /ASSEMBLY_ACC=CAM_ASM_000771 /TAXON_ID=215587 /ORGANISM="Aplanochytrium stocchinoi, Strain GSBS06" /LENGTH=289 /DNA_ID=CAMNT_0051955811 /DNA_START=27 /DNA_END=896 /DNA_ORIENTATION=-